MSRVTTVDDVWLNVDSMLHQVQKCPTCGRVRETNPNGIWQPWMDASRVGAAVVQRAEQRQCESCTKQRHLVFD